MTPFSPHGAVAGAAFSPDNARVATCSWDGTIKVWNAATGVVELKFEASPDMYVNSVVFSPDGKRLLSASDDKTAKIWDAATGQQLLSFPAQEGAEGHTQKVFSARFSDDGKRIVTASGDKTAQRVGCRNGKNAVRPCRARMVCAVGRFLARRPARHDRECRQFGTHLGRGNRHREIPYARAHGGRDQRGILARRRAPISGGQDDAVKLWDATTGREILHLKQHTQEVSSVSFSPDGKSMLTSSRDGTAILWPAVDWK